MFHLSSKCTIQRASTVTDRYQNDKRTYSDYEKLVPCLLITTAEKAIDPVTGQVATKTGYKLIMEPGQDVIASDRITDLVDRSGASLAGDYDVIGVIPHNGMMARLMSVELEKVK